MQLPLIGAQPAACAFRKFDGIWLDKKSRVIRNFPLFLVKPQYNSNVGVKAPSIHLMRLKIMRLCRDMSPESHACNGGIVKSRYFACPYFLFRPSDATASDGSLPKHFSNIRFFYVLNVVF
jgi:hypothetical protein